MIFRAATANPEGEVKAVNDPFRNPGLPRSHRQPGGVARIGYAGGRILFTVVAAAHYMYMREYFKGFDYGDMEARSDKTLAFNAFVHS